MTQLARSLAVTLALAFLVLTQSPASSAWGQLPQAPPGDVPVSGSNPSHGTASSDAPVQAVSERTDVQDAGPGFSFLKVVGGLGLVLCLIVLGTFGIRKLAPQYFAKTAPERGLRLLETLPMGDRRSIAVIEIGERRLLIGNTPNQITLLAALGEESPLHAANDTAALAAPAFKNLYEFEKNGPSRGKMTILPPHVRDKMRQLRESLER